MENGYCPITLKKKNTANKKPPKRSQSAPRRSYSSLAVRNLNSSTIRSQKVDELKKEIDQEKKMQSKPMTKNLKPAIRHRRDNKLWDDEGCIIETNKPPIQKKDENKKDKYKSKMNPKSKEIVQNKVSYESSNQSIINRIRPPSRAQSVVSLHRKPNHMDEFLDRQNRSVKTRESSVKQMKKTEKEQRNKSYMNNESKKILLSSQSSADLLAPRRSKKQEDFSFQSNTSIISSQSVKVLPNKLNRRKNIFYEMELLEAQMEKEANETFECTFTSESSLSKNSFEIANNDKDQTIQINENRSNKSVKNMKRKRKEDNKVPCHANEVPKRTRYINELLSGLRTTPCY